MVEIEAVEDPKLWPTLPSLVEPYRRNSEHLSAGKSPWHHVLGWVAERYPAMVRRIADEGHELATHSYWHRKVYSLTPEAFLEDMRRSIDHRIRIGITGPWVPSTFFSLLPAPSGRLMSFMNLVWNTTQFVPRRTGPRWVRLPGSGSCLWRCPEWTASA